MREEPPPPLRPPVLVKNSLLRAVGLSWSCSRTAQILRPGRPSLPPLTRTGGEVGSHTPVEVGKGPHFPSTGPLCLLPLIPIMALLMASSGLGTIAESVLHTLTQGGIMSILHTGEHRHEEAKLFCK